MKKIIEVGQFVKSNFRARWIGIIEKIEVQEGSGKSSKKICEVVILKDRNGNTMKKRNQSILSSDWLEITEPVELTEKQVMWIRNNKLRNKLIFDLNEKNEKKN